MIALAAMNVCLVFEEQHHTHIHEWFNGAGDGLGQPGR
jgi:hypothetical protein